MRLLFVHQNFPGQFRHLAPALAARGHEVVALGINDSPPLPGVTTYRYRVQPPAARSGHSWVADFETKVVRAEACARAALELDGRGFRPDLIYAHPGWGEALLLRQVWPEARQLHFVELFYATEGLDVGFDPEFDRGEFELRCRVTLKKAALLQQLQEMDAGLSPTRFQWQTLPPEYRDRVRVIHDGIDTAVAAPNPDAILDVPLADGSSLTLSAADEVITFVARNLEPMRGYHSFMRALPALLARRPQARVLIVGGEGVSYGPTPKEGGYKQRFLAEVADRIDLERVHFLGQIPYGRFLAMLQISSAHVYLTYPFVLSWSLLEALSCGCVVVGSRTPPVEEVIRDGENGLLVDFFEPEQLAATVAGILEDPQRAAALRAQARQTVLDHYDLQTICLPRQIELVESLV